MLRNGHLQDQGKLCQTPMSLDRDSHLSLQPDFSKNKMLDVKLCNKTVELFNTCLRINGYMFVDTIKRQAFSWHNIIGY